MHFKSVLNTTEGLKIFEKSKQLLDQLNFIRKNNLLVQLILNVKMRQWNKLRINNSFLIIY